MVNLMHAFFELLLVVHLHDLEVGVEPLAPLSAMI